MCFNVMYNGMVPSFTLRLDEKCSQYKLCEAVYAIIISY